jgi:hypothetical protein
MDKVQKRLKESVGKQSLESLDKLSTLLDSDQQIGQGMEEDLLHDAGDGDRHLAASPAIDAAETSAPTHSTIDIRGENKAPLSKRSKRRKHKLGSKRPENYGSGKKSPVSTGSKPQPRFFCQF